MAALKIVCDGCQASFKGFQWEAGSAGYDDIPSHHACLFCGRPLKTSGVTVRGDGSSQEVRVEIVNPVYPCLYRSDDDLCRLHQQREERRLKDDEWQGADRPGRCVFAGTDCITGKSCPAFNVTAPGEVQKGAYARHPEEMSQTPVHGAALERSHPLLRSREEFEHDDIQFCAQEGVITSSFCVYCRNYTGKHAIGDREKRRADTCQQACVTLGQIGEVRAEFFSQWVIDEMRSDRGYKDFFPVPVPANYIKSAFNTEATEWDRHQYIYHHCMRCNATSGIHHHCHDCGTRRLCNQCVEDRTETPETDGSVTIKFRCPDCGAANAFNGGKFGWGETRFDTNDLPHSRLRKPFVEINYWTLKEREAGFWRGPDDTAAYPLEEPENANKIPDCTPPTGRCKYVIIRSGLMAGVYAIDDYLRQAYLVVDLDDQTLAVRGAISPFEPYSYNIDTVLSYRIHDLDKALEIKKSLFKNGLSCILIQYSNNTFDTHWGIRYASIIQRAKSIIVIPSPHYFETGSATMAELEELQAVARHRKKSGPTCSQAFLLWMSSAAHTNEHQTSGFLPVSSQKQIIEHLTSAPDGVTYFEELRGKASIKASMAPSVAPAKKLEVLDQNAYSRLMIDGQNLLDAGDPQSALTLFAKCEAVDRPPEFNRMSLCLEAMGFEAEALAFLLQTRMKILNHAAYDQVAALYGHPEIDDSRFFKSSFDRDFLARVSKRLTELKPYLDKAMTVDVRQVIEEWQNRL